MIQLHMGHIIDTMTPEVLEKETFAVVTDCRNNEILSFNTSLKVTVCNALPNDKGLKIQLKNPSKTIYATAFKSVAGFSVLSDFQGKARFNIHRFE